jgi:putative GTP pyrophosphokinase
LTEPNAMGNTAAEILSDYDSKCPELDAFRITCERLVHSLLAAASLRVHSVASRLKSRASLSAKLARPGKQYSILADVTDVVGLRIITYFEDEVDEVGRLIAGEFSVDAGNSVDKRQALDPDRFGYLSQHYVCSMSDTRLNLSEYRHCRSMVLEIQVRTILQHGWAEIEHDLGYKAAGPVAVPLRRRFSRLAGLLELADAEFARLRQDIRRYEGEVRAKLVADAATVQIDEVSIAQFVASDELLARLERAMAEIVGGSTGEGIDSGPAAEWLRYAGVSTIEQLQQELARLYDVIVAQWRHTTAPLGLNSGDRLSRGIGLFHLFRVLVFEQGGLAKLTEAFARFGVASPDNDTEQRILEWIALRIEAALKGREPGSDGSPQEPRKTRR